MAYLPISKSVPQYSTSSNELADGYYLKGYLAGTTTALSMATDEDAGTLIAKCKIGAKGYPLSDSGDESSIFIPYFNRDYKLVLYKNDADADADNTGAADWVVDNIKIGTTDTYSALYTAGSSNSIVSQIANSAAAVGDIYESNYYDTNLVSGSGAKWKVTAVDASTPSGTVSGTQVNGRNVYLPNRASGDGILYVGANAGNTVYYKVEVVPVNGIRNGNAYGVRVGATEADNANALSNAFAQGGMVEFAAGVYDVSGDAVEIVDGLRIVNSQDVEFKSSGFPILKVPTGVVDNFEFHGILRTTSTDNTNDEKGLLDSRTSGSSKDWDITGIRFYCADALINGVKLIASSSANTIVRPFDNIDFDGQQYVECGRMGFEVINQGTTTITGISIASEAVISYSGADPSNGDPVIFENITGTNAVDDLNKVSDYHPNIYTVSDVDTDASTFKIKNANGDYVATTGGTYTSGGDVYVFRYRGFKGKVNATKTGILNSARGMGVSFDGYSLSHDVEVTCQDNSTCALENVGASQSRFFVQAIGTGTDEPISSSGSRKKFGNVYGILGRYASRAYFENDYGAILSDETHCYLGGDLEVKSGGGFVISPSAYIEGGQNYGAYFEGSPAAKVFGTVSNENASSPFSVVRFYGSGSTGGLINGTLIRGSGGEWWDEQNSASDNYARMYRKGRTSEPEGGILPTNCEVVTGNVTPGGTTSTCTITFASTASWRPAVVHVLATTNATGGGNRGGAYHVRHLAHVNSANSQNAANADLVTSAGCVLTTSLSAGGNNTVRFTATVASGTPVHWQVMVSDYAGRPQSVVFA